jgi:hypothetical protein
MLIAAALVFWFFEKKEKEIQKSIHQIETTQ